jgi:hypothetical protein
VRAREALRLVSQISKLPVFSFFFFPVFLFFFLVFFRESEQVKVRKRRGWGEGGAGSSPAGGFSFLSFLPVLAVFLVNGGLLLPCVWSACGGVGGFGVQ